MNAQKLASALYQHQHIALDFDDCLLDGPYSRLLTDYISAHPEKMFSIITNRPSRCERDTVAVANGLILLRDIPQGFQFTHIVLSPDADLCGDTVDAHFKGKAAASIGASILVDDDIGHAAGCDVYGIIFLHLACDESGPPITTGLF